MKQPCFLETLLLELPSLASGRSNPSMMVYLQDWSSQHPNCLQIRGRQKKWWLLPPCCRLKTSVATNTEYSTIWYGILMTVIAVLICDCNWYYLRLLFQLLQVNTNYISRLYVNYFQDINSVIRWNSSAPTSTQEHLTYSKQGSHIANCKVAFSSVTHRTRYCVCPGHASIGFDSFIRSSEGF